MGAVRPGQRDRRPGNRADDLAADAAAACSTGLLQAAAGSKPEAFAGELVTLYQTLLAAGRQAVLKQMLVQPETTAALLDAFGGNRSTRPCSASSKSPRCAGTRMRRFASGRPI